MDSFAAFPLNDSTGEPLGLLVAMDRQPIAGGDADHAEAMLKIIAGRVAAEIERERTDEALRAVALAVSGARSGTVFDELVRMLATILRVEVAFIARYEPAQPDSLRMLAMYYDGQVLQDITLSRSPARPARPCWATLPGLSAPTCRRCFPDDQDAARAVHRELCRPSAGRRWTARRWASSRWRRAGRLTQLDRVESMLKIFAVRAAAEIERLRASEALQRSEASYRAIFEASEDAIFIHDWETGAMIDVNTKACEIYGYSREELRRASDADTCSGVPPYTAEEALRRMQLAKLGRCPPFEWQRRNKDGSLHWDEVRLKPVDARRPAAPAGLQPRHHGAEAGAGRPARARGAVPGDLRELAGRPVHVGREPARRRREPGRARAVWLPRAKTSSAATLPEHHARRTTCASGCRSMRARAGRREHRTWRPPCCGPTAASFDADLRVMPFVQRGQPHALAVVRDISERRRRERELQRSEARLRATVEAAFDGVVGMDSEGRIVEFNAAAERVFGHRRADVLGRRLADVILPERLPRGASAGREQFPRQRAAAPWWAGWWRPRRCARTAARFPVELAISVAAVPEGSIFVGHLRDITERRRADQALRDSEEQYRAIFNASADALVLRDADFSIVDVNATYEAMSGYPRAEVLGVDRVLANPPEVMATIRALHEKALAGADRSRSRPQLLRRDGQRYDLELRGVPIQHRGQPHVLYIGRDITQGKRAERALRDSEEQYRAIFNASADALVLRDAEFRAVEVNPAYADA